MKIVVLAPGNNGQHCLYNGEHSDSDGNNIEICCDQCDYLICCTNFDGLCDKCFEKNGFCQIEKRSAVPE